MKLKDIQGIFHKELDAIYGKEEVFSFFFICLESFYNISRLQLATDPELSITKEEQEPIFDALERLKQQQPIQYIIGKARFYGELFKVDSNTLIPRSETEEMVDSIIKETVREIGLGNLKAPIYILDIGTGSGCIAVTLAKQLPEAEVFALDVSKGALKVAQENAKLNEVKVNFIEADILDTKNIENQPKFDVIVSNPPYVRELEKKQMRANVLENEPHLALFVEDDNPLIFYKAITEFAEHNLKPEGVLYFEINEYLASETLALVDSYSFNEVEVRKDMFGKYRILKAIKSE